MSKLTGAVTIVATEGEAGKGGFTATAVCSVSDNPATLLVCINRNNDLEQVIEKNQSFTVNLLSTEQKALANRFAGLENIPSAERLEVGFWSKGKTGSPLLMDCLASFECKLTNAVPTGTHTVLFGEVINLLLNHSQSQPLLYYNRSYNTIKFP
ncbi:flavin reductase family protein [Rapidithrix thailandica]